MIANSQVSYVPGGVVRKYTKLQRRSSHRKRLVGCLAVGTPLVAGLGTGHLWMGACASLAIGIVLSLIAVGVYSLNNEILH